MDENLKKEETSTLTHTALGLFNYPGKIAWNVAVIEFNPITKEAKFVREVVAGDGRDVAIERFKIMAATHVMVVE